MGSIVVHRWIPTDAYVSFRHEMSIDLEDSDDTFIYEEARNAGVDEQPPADLAKRLEETLRERLEERGNENLENMTLDDLDEYEIRIQWQRKYITICEWCKSPNCDGDPDDCEQVPDYCEGCENYTGGECDCVYCAHCEEWNSDECEHDNDVDVVMIMTLLKPVIEVKEEAKEEETIL
jgi:hypothetical protein